MPLLERLQSIRWRHAVIGAVVLLLGVLLFGVNVARGVPDLSADDPVIADHVVKAFPQYTDQQRADVVRCLAEYVELTIAANRGAVPPDEDDHSG